MDYRIIYIMGNVFHIGGAAIYKIGGWFANQCGPIHSRRYMAMTAYFDESGTHGAASPAIVVAGFGGTDAQWVGLKKRLTKLFSDFSIQKFHASDLRNTKGDFKGWDSATKARFNSRFLRMVDEQLSFGVAGVVSSEDYQSHYRSHAFPRRSRPDTEYGICLRAALFRSLVFIAERRTDWPLNIVMELGHRNEGDAVRVFNDVKQRPPSSWYVGALGSITFASKANCQFLSVADSLAYHLFRNVSGRNSHPTNPIAVPIGEADPPYYVSKIGMSRTLLRPEDLISLRQEHAAA
jgi:hypothetical protein